MFTTLHCPKCQHLWKFPFATSLHRVPDLHIFSILWKAVWKMCLKREGYGARWDVAPQSPWDRTGDKGFILKTDYCFLTTQCLAFNSMDHTGWIALLILSFPTATAGSEETAIWESSSITVLHQSQDVNQREWRNTPYRMCVTDISSTGCFTYCWASTAKNGGFNS